jgi:hypothetical protein
MAEERGKMSFLWGMLAGAGALLLLGDLVTKGALHKIIWVLILALVNYITTGDSGLH